MTKHRIQTPQAKRLREQGLAHATAHALSGLARKVYAEQAGISVYKLDYWRTLARRLGMLADTPIFAISTAADQGDSVPSSVHRN